MCIRDSKMTVDALPQIMFEISENVKRKYKLRVFEAKTIKLVAEYVYKRQLQRDTAAGFFNVLVWIIIVMPRSHLKCLRKDARNNLFCHLILQVNFIIYTIFLLCSEAQSRSFFLVRRLQCG